MDNSVRVGEFEGVADGAADRADVARRQADPRVEVPVD